MDVIYSEKSKNTFYTPDLNVGIGKYILGEYTLDDSEIISSDELKRKELDENLLNWLGDLSNERIIRGCKLDWKENIGNGFLYTMDYNHDIFREPNILGFNENNCLIKIYCKIKGELKDEFLHELEKKYGENRNWEWEIKNFYRTEVFNLYGVIQIRFIFNEEKNRAGLEMYFTQLDTTKPQIDKIDKEKRKRENEQLKNQDEINNLKMQELEKENKLKKSIQDLLDF